MKNKITKTEKIKKIVKNKGFTIVETLIAISILAIALTGPLAIISQSLRSSYFARDQVTAHYLAQEAIEFIRNKRDRNGLQQLSANDWLSGITTSTDTSENILNEVNSSINKAHLVRTSNGYSIRKCTPNGNVDCPPLKYNAEDRIYGDDSSFTDSIFTREIVMAKSPGDADAKREIIISVRVSWNAPSTNNSIVIDEHLYNWQLELPTAE